MAVNFLGGDLTARLNSIPNVAGSYTTSFTDLYRVVNLALGANNPFNRAATLDYTFFKPSSGPDKAVAVGAAVGYRLTESILPTTVALLRNGKLSENVIPSKYITEDELGLISDAKIPPSIQRESDAGPKVKLAWATVGPNGHVGTGNSMNVILPVRVIDNFKAVVSFTSGFFSSLPSVTAIIYFPSTGEAQDRAQIQLTRITNNSVIIDIQSTANPNIGLIKQVGFSLNAIGLES